MRHQSTTRRVLSRESAKNNHWQNNLFSTWRQKPNRKRSWLCLKRQAIKATSSQCVMTIDEGVKNPVGENFGVVTLSSWRTRRLLSPRPKEFQTRLGFGRWQSPTKQVAESFRWFGTSVDDGVVGWRPSNVATNTCNIIIVTNHSDSIWSCA